MWQIEPICLRIELDRYGGFKWNWFAVRIEGTVVSLWENFVDLENSDRMN